jgi:Ca-activated chloride channel homolog
MTQFHQPSVWFLLLLLLLPLVWWAFRSPKRQAKLRYSATDVLGGIRPGLAVRGRIALPILRLAAIALVVLALARPQKGNEQTRVFSEGIAIQMLVDRSGSMQAMDFKIDDERVDRLTAVRKVVREFVMGGNGLRGREDDLVGLIAFARFADSQCPLTLDHGYMLDTLSKTEIVTEQNEDGTAIGDAIALGIERLRSLENERRFQGAHKIKSKIMILLTDGENNAGDVEPAKAAELAAKYGIRIYTIGAGTEGMAPFPAMNPITGQKVFRQMVVTIDETGLKKIAEVTGAKYFRATDTETLHHIYQEIDKLEKTKTEEKRYSEYRELATEPIQFGHLRLPPLLLAAFVVLTFEMVLANTWLRKSP